MSLGPFFRSPFTDLTASMVNFQQYDKCGELEMASIDCLEAYGTVKGSEKCANILADFQECAFMNLQMKRFQVSAVTHSSKCPKEDSFNFIAGYAFGETSSGSDG